MGAHARSRWRVQSNWDQIVENFDDMNLREELLRGIYAYGFEKPSAIQQRAIMPVLKGRDVIAQAQSGTGKTATFAISILQRLDVSMRECQALVLAPTRELAQQIQKVVTALSDYMNIESMACIGGTVVREDLKKLEVGVHVVVGTPGRVFDMIQRRALRTDHIKMFVLDEADEMLSRGFKDQIYDVFQLIPAGVQVVLLSAAKFHSAALTEEGQLYTWGWGRGGRLGGGGRRHRRRCGRRGQQAQRREDLHKAVDLVDEKVCVAARRLRHRHVQQIVGHVKVEVARVAGRAADQRATLPADRTRLVLVAHQLRAVGRGTDGVECPGATASSVQC